MQTFLPYPDFYDSCAVLDRQRLGKQRVETWQIMHTLINGSKWASHPAVKMWRGYHDALSNYLRANILVWCARGYNNSIPIPPLREADPPPWLGRPNFHASHRSNLLRKNPEHYAQFGWTERNDLPYEWPLSDRSE